MVQPDVLLELVCCKLLIEFQQESCKISEKSKIQSALKGIELLVHLQVEIFVRRQNSFVWTGQKVGAVLGPNKLCVCISNGADGFIRNSGSDTIEHVECATVVDSLSSVADFMTDCLQTFSFRNFVLSSLCLIVDKGNDIVDEDEEGNITKVVLENFKLSQNVLMVKFRNRSLPKAAYNYIAQQFHDCKKLELLHLEELNCDPIEIIRAISKMSFLGRFHMNNCFCETQTLKAAGEVLRRCIHLQTLSLAFTKGVPTEFAESLSKMTLIEILILENCLRPPTGKALMQALPNCSKLKHLNLRANLLTDCIADLLDVDNHPGFCNLTYLDLDGTGLSRDDVANLGTALRSQKLPTISDLRLSCNDLTNCVRSLFDSATITSLQSLSLGSTKLIDSDMACLSEVVQNKRFPKLENLYLHYNNLGSMEKETKELLSSCVGQYAQTQFVLELKGNDLSDAFQDEAAALCFGTKIKLTSLSLS